MWPATISASPSTTSKGWRLVSTTPEIRYTRKIGSKGSQFQDRTSGPCRQPCLCLPQHDFPPGSCCRDHDHDQETEAHCDFVAHHLRRAAGAPRRRTWVGGPARNDHAITSMDVIAITNNRPAFTFARATSGPNGNRHQAAKGRHDGHDRPQDEQGLLAAVRAG